MWKRKSGHMNILLKRETSEETKKRSITHATLDMNDEGLSEEERRADALALRAEERRDKLRKAAGSGKYTLIRRYLNGETHVRRPYVPCNESIVVRREPGELKHLSSRRRRKKKELKFLSIPKVAASEMGRAQTGMRAFRGSDCENESSRIAERFWEDRPERVRAP